MFGLSFVREANDLREMRKLFEGSNDLPLVVAKIEDQSAVHNIHDIVHEADAIMVARGDLGIEVPFEELPIIQRKIVKGCLRVGRPVIVATHMLESMIENPLPTRAEVTDVSNAVFEQADAIMLSGETTVGKYPVECVQVFDRIARRIERSGGANYQEHAEFTSPRQKLVKSAVVMADELRADAILVFTIHGPMARYTSWMRPRVSPIYAICPSESVASSLAINRGLTPFVTPFSDSNPEETIGKALAILMKRGILKRG